MAVQAAAAIGRSKALRGAPAVRRSISRAAVDGAGPSSNCPELDCVRALLPRDVIEDAAYRAVSLGVGADRVLVTAGTLSDEAYLRVLAGALGAAFEPLEGVARAQCPVDDERLIESAAAGMLPLSVDGELYLVIAPRGTAARRILQLIKKNPARARLFRFTSAERLNRFVLQHAGAAIARKAVNSLKRKWPILTAAPPRWRTNIPCVAAVMLLALVAFVMVPAGTMLVFEVMLAAMFLADQIGVRALVALTESGGTALWLSRYRSAVPIYALSRNAAALRRMLLYRDVYPIEFDPGGVGPTQAAREAIRHLFALGHLAVEDRVIVTNGDHTGRLGGTNTLKLLKVGENGVADGLGDL